VADPFSDPGLAQALAQASPEMRRLILERISPPPPPPTAPPVAAWSQSVDTASGLLDSGAIPAAAGVTTTTLTVATYADRAYRAQRALQAMVRFGMPAARAAAAVGTTVAEMDAVAAGTAGVGMATLGVGLLAGLTVAGVVAGGIYLWHRSGSSPATASATTVATSVTPSPSASTGSGELDKPFASPQYLIHITGHGTYDGPVTDDAMWLFPAEPDGQGYFKVPDGTGGTYTYSSDFHAGPFGTPREVCSGGGGRAAGSLSAWDSNESFTCPSG